MSNDFLIADMRVQAILDRWPHTAMVFNHYSSICMGCAIARFCTISDTARIYGLPLEAFVDDLKQVIEDQKLNSVFPE